MPQSNDDKGIIDAGKLSVDDILDDLNKVDEDKSDLLSDDKSDDKPDEDDKDEDKKDEKKDDDKDEKPLELEDETPVEDDLELITPVKRRDILKKYPEIFKDFPYLEKAYYKEQQYTEIFPTIDDAREAVERSDTFKKFESDLLKGDPTSVLKSVKEIDPDAFGRIVDNYLPTLQRVDQNAYYHIVGNIIKSTVVSMVREADTSKNEDLKAAAIILHQFINGNSQFEPPKNFGKPQSDNSEDAKLKAERAEFFNERLSSVKDDLDTKTTNVIKSTISQHIDPKGVMTDYVRKTATKDALESLEDLIGNDSRFRTVLDKLWGKAIESNFSKSSVDSIRSAYLSKAKTLLGSVIQKSRNEALKGLGKRVADEPDTKTDRKGPQGHKMAQKDSAVPKKMTSLEYLMQD